MSERHSIPGEVALGRSVYGVQSTTAKCLSQIECGVAP